MDLVFLGAIALLWGAVAALVSGLEGLRPARGERP